MLGLVPFDAGVYSIDAVCFVLFFGRCGSLIAVARTSPLIFLRSRSVDMGAMGHLKLRGAAFGPSRVPLVRSGSLKKEGRSA